VTNIKATTLNTASFGPNLKRIREERKLSRESFAERIGVSSRIVYDYENNLKYPSFERFVQIAQVLGVGLDSILEN
jgi:transcriptional regulator with XRE-family HTH domain